MYTPATMATARRMSRDLQPDVLSRGRPPPVMAAPLSPRSPDRAGISVLLTWAQDKTRNPLSQDYQREQSASQHSAAGHESAPSNSTAFFSGPPGAYRLPCPPGYHTTCERQKQTHRMHQVN